ncbi:Hypothetical protein AA314_05981 [Archangium gephyra]|uniref:Uncharacterized protein n=1 Tax=Archangium gephyra TaxID=48 RepID=A0AAC8QBK8_9BACT|nr:Hypothetical protein AA314_05981 [Archangium gephyra]
MKNSRVAHENVAFLDAHGRGRSPSYSGQPRRGHTGGAPE